MSSQSLLEKCCLIGQPVAGNPTHYMIEQAIRQADAEWRFLSFEVRPEDLGDAMRGIRALDFRGVKVIAPYREAVLEFVDQRTHHAQLAGSANCVTRGDDQLVADNTLGQALVSFLKGIEDPAGKHVTLLGAGSAACAIGTALALAGARCIIIANRTPEKAESLVRVISEQTSTSAICTPWPDRKLTVDADTDLLIQATSLGDIDPDAPLPIDVASLRPELVVDVTYNPPSTWLLREATRANCRTVDGLTLLVEQTAMALHQWSGIEADRDTMRDAAEEFLAI